MDFIFDFFLHLGLITGVLVLYLLLFKRETPDGGNYKRIGWNYPLKLLLARFAVRRWKSKLPPTRLDELPRPEQYEGWDNFALRTSATDGSTILLGIRKQCGRQPLAEVMLYVKLPDGTSYKLLQHPDTVVSVWENVEGGWSSGGLKIQVLEPQKRYRFLFNGCMTRNDDGVTQHVKLNLIWASATKPIRYPHDWSNELAAQALALENWRDDKWPYMLGKWEEGGWFLWGTAQGRFQSFNENGDIDENVYLRTRGIKERYWAPHAYQGLRRSITITAGARDGTAVHLRCLSYKKVLTRCISGWVRYPDYTISNITSTDLVMADFCERPDGIPQAYTINVSTCFAPIAKKCNHLTNVKVKKSCLLGKAKKTDLNLVLRINDDGGKLLNGVPYQQETLYRTMNVNINCEPGTGVLELGYEPTEIRDPFTRIMPLRVLKWLTEKQAGEVGYCLPFEDRACACPAYVGGKGASLALLASVQKDECYRVPPGFCLTTKALEKHLKLNPELTAAIREIEAANENYNEEIFKEKCKKTSELFITTEIKGDIKDELLESMKTLRITASEQNLGPELRFAVRSSAVGEDSEELSAAGQNDTILGCVSDADVLDGVQKCWASMFAFTSAYYRRQNGQPCLCGAGVVVQVLVAPRAAGVMFTRHPAHGDPTRLLITANYGLGESVVSGAVEPDTITLKRHVNGKLIIAKTEVGSKSRRVKTEGSGIAMEDVPEGDRNVSCLSEADVMKLAKIGVVQEELWGAGRDIEWAVTETDIFLLQARPITSLDRWTDEELLHELDSPIMADDELLSFGNTGEVLPKPLTAMSFDMVNTPLIRGINNVTGSNGSGYDDSVMITHNRCVLSLYITVYRRVPKEIDVNIRILEYSVHGHKVAGNEIHSTALHRRSPHWTDSLIGIWFMIKILMMSKKRMDKAIQTVNTLNYTLLTEDPMKLLEIIKHSRSTMEGLSSDHAWTSSASTCSQVIAMIVFLEGKSDFNSEQCNEISSLFSSGDVLSAELPVALANIVQKLEHSGLAEKFRAQDPKTGIQWLKKNAPAVYLDVCTFLDHHGYRAVMEFDLVTKPWILVPEEMIKVLQNLHVSTAGTKAKSSEEVIASLTTPEKDSTRKILRWILPLCRRTVRHRESTKAHLILAVHKLRLGFLQLGRILVRKWYIPNPDLVFFFRFEELLNYYKNRDPALLKKALQRQQYYPNWCKLKFAEINTGWVDPLEVKRPNVTAGDVKIQATSVCGGEVVARACVIKDISEIGQLQRGDVLITHATDIGWSPYFPLLTGIVTELGGLISHGAVIAREYGLPCIVGAAFATDLFQTGDTIRLSGTNGIIEKVEVEEIRD